MTSWLPELPHHRDDLLDEQRVSGSCGANPVAKVRWHATTGREQLVDQGLGISSVERLEQNRGGIELSSTPAGPAVDQFRPAQAEYEDRSVAAEVADMLDEVEQG